MWVSLSTEIKVAFVRVTAVHLLPRHHEIAEVVAVRILESCKNLALESVVLLTGGGSLSNVVMHASFFQHSHPT